MGSSVDEGVAGPVCGGGRQNLGEGGGLGRDDHWVFFAPTVVPGFGAGLRVEVNDDDLVAGGFGCAGEVDRQRGLTPRRPSGRGWRLYSCVH